MWYFDTVVCSEYRYIDWQGTNPLWRSFIQLKSDVVNSTCSCLHAPMPSTQPTLLVSNGSFVFQFHVTEAMGTAMFYFQYDGHRMDLTPKCFPYILLMTMSTSASTSSSLDSRHIQVRLTSVTVLGVFWLNFIVGPSCENLSLIDNHIVQRRETWLEYRHIQWITGHSDPWRWDHHAIWKRLVLIIQCDAAAHLRRTDT